MKRKGLTKHHPILGFMPKIVLVLAILAAAVCFSYKNYLFKIQTSPTPTATLNPTASWTTFRSTKYNFLFKHPADLGGQGSISGPTTGTVTGLQSFTDPKTIQMGTNAHFDGFSVYVVTKLGTANFDKYINKEIIAMNAAKFTGMRNPTKIQLPNGIALVSKDEGQAYYYLPNSDQSEIVVFAYLQADDSFKQTFDQILSTFKFIDNTQTSLIPADSQTPAAAICTQVQGPGVLITLNVDAPSPSCIEVSANQKLTLVNGTNQTVSLKYHSYGSQILPDSNYTFPQALGLFLAPGVHIITTSLYGGGGPEVWLR